MRLRCWGTRGNLATPSVDTLTLGGNSSCYEVELAPARTILLDCGTGLIEYATWLLARDDEPVPEEHHIVLTHFHWDHVLGFPFFHVIHRPNTKVHLYSGFEESQLEDHVRALFDGTYSPLRNLDNLAAKVFFHRITGDGRDICGAHVRTQRVDHSEVCFAVRIDSANTSLCYATDHEARDAQLNTELLRFARGVNTLLHDAQYTAEEYQAHQGWGHSSMEAALDNALRAKVSRLLLTHHDPTHTDAFRLAYLAGIAKKPGTPAHALARQGVWYDM